MHKNFKELISRDELYSLDRECLEKHTTEHCWREIQGEGEDRVAYCSPKGYLQFKLSVIHQLRGVLRRK